MHPPYLLYIEGEHNGMNDAVSGLASKTSSEFIMQWCIVFLIMIIVLMLIGPKLIRFLNNVRNKVNYGEDLVSMVTKHEKEIAEVDKKLARDYEKINSILELLNRQESIQKDSLEERELLMRTLLAVLKGLQEVGANGPTKQAQHEIEIYLNKQAHEPR